jgi:dihydropteroate synthase
MGVINTTPDSFSDGGRFDTTDKAFEHAQRLISEGADLRSKRNWIEPFR